MINLHANENSKYIQNIGRDICNDGYPGIANIKFVSRPHQNNYLP